MIPATLFEGALRKFFGPINEFLDDERVTEILVNGPSEVYVERKGLLARTPATFKPGELDSALRVVAQFVGRPFDAGHPILEARLPDGSRLEALLPCVATGGPAVAIRRFSKDRLTLAKLLDYGALTQDAANLLNALVGCKQNVVVAGGTGSGKTSLLNALSAFIPSGERTIVIEDAHELDLQNDHVVAFEARPADERGAGAVTIRDLFKASLRMRPDRIVIGEIRSGEAFDLIQAMTSGHGGCLTTVHATYPADTLHRLETMALMSGVDIPLSALRAQLANAVDIVVQTARQNDGRRRVTHITEVRGVDGTSGYLHHDLFALGASSPRSSGSARELVPTGNVPDCLDALVAHGFEPAAFAHARSDGDLSTGECR